MSTYSANLAIELIGTGEQSGTWGNTTNTNLGTLLEQAISGYVTYACTGGTDTITIPSGAYGVARNMYIELTGTGGGTVLVPTNKKLYFFYNNTASAITVKVSGQTGVSIPAGAKMGLASNGTDVVSAVSYFPSLTLGTALPLASGGTGATSASDARTALDAPSTSGSGATGTWGINISGNAATVTNGVYTSSSYANPAWITSLAGSKITGSISGGAGSVANSLTVINNGTGAASGSTFNGSSAVTISYNSVGAPSSSGTGASGTWAISITGNAATVTNGVYTSSSYADPSWLTSLAGSKITGNISGSAAGLTSTLAVASGGTGATDAATARTNLDVPSRSGSGASGTWGINISGNAATVTNGITTSNYNSYSPTLTGTGASGTWAINISGNAATATSATSVSGTSSNGYGTRTVSSSSPTGGSDGDIWYLV